MTSNPLPSCCRVAAVACLLTLACDSPASPGRRSEYQLLFVSAEGGVLDGRLLPDGISGTDIYRMNSDGTGRQNLTNQSTYVYPTGTLAVEYRSLALSPDGRTIAFESTRETGCAGIWGMNIDGSGLRKLSIGTLQETRCNYFPVWSPDGNHIAFTTSREGNFPTYVMNADGTNPRNVAPLHIGNNWTWPTGWAPDGRVVVRNGSQGYIVNADGTNLELLFGRTDDHSAEWSPDGAKVAFIRNTTSGSSLFVMNADGTDVRQLTNRPGQDEFWGDWFTNDYERWSPDGKRLVFTNSIDGRSELHVIDADGTNDVQLTNYTADFNGWAPDGRITFNSAVSGSQEIYLINPDGTGRVNLTNTPNSQELRGLWVRAEPGS